MSRAAVPGFASALLLLLVPGPGVPAALAADAGGPRHWIHDQLRVDLRSGPSFEYRIIDFLPTGTPLTILEEGDAWVRVQARGEEGWIQAQYVTDQPVAALRLARLQDEHAATVDALERSRARAQALEAELAELSTAHEQASAAVERLREELGRVRAVSAAAIETAAERDALAEVRAELDARVETLAQENERLRWDNRVEGIQWGAGAVLAGAILTWIVWAFASRRRPSSWV